MSQEQKHRPAEKKPEETAAPCCPKQAEKAKLDDETAALVDAIDDVLETDCERFVKEYVQRGGE